MRHDQVGLECRQLEQVEPGGGVHLHHGGGLENLPGWLQALVILGVIAAIYLREYAKSGPIVSAVRISINNLAGVPSIVFGVFGLGFFCYIIGAFWDGGPRNIDLTPMPGLRWWTLLIVLAVLVGLLLAGFFAGGNGEIFWLNVGLGLDNGISLPYFFSNIYDAAVKKFFVPFALGWLLAAERRLFSSSSALRSALSFSMASATVAVSGTAASSTCMSPPAESSG